MKHSRRFAGKQLAEVAVADKNPVQLDYTKIGYFKLADWDESRQCWAAVEYIDGTKVQLPVTYTIGHTWKLSDNHHPIKATLSQGYSNIPLHDLFSGSNSRMKPPEFAERVSEGGRPKAKAKARGKVNKGGKEKVQEVEKIAVSEPEGDSEPVPPLGWGGAQ